MGEWKSTSLDRNKNTTLRHFSHASTTTATLQLLLSHFENHMCLHPTYLNKLLCCISSPKIFNDCTELAALERLGLRPRGLTLEKHIGQERSSKGINAFSKASNLPIVFVFSLFAYHARYWHATSRCSDPFLKN
jgi:hypothetical protein